MPGPSSALVSRRPDLAEGLVEFDLQMDRSGFIWNRVLPVNNVRLSSGTYPRLSIEELLKNRDVARAPKGGYSRSDWKFGNDTYTTTEYGAEEPIDDNQAADYAEYFDLELESTQIAADAVLRAAEKRVADAVFNTTTWTGGLTTGVTTEWSTASSCVPITDVKTARQTIWNRTGMWANTLIINRQVFHNLRESAQIIDRIESSGAGNPTKASDVTAAMLAAAFDLEQVIVAGSAKNTAQEGQSLSLSQIWSSEYAMVCYINYAQSMRTPTLGRMMHWTADGSQVQGIVETYRDEGVRADIVRVRHQVGEKIVYPELGQLLSNITA